MSDIMKHTNAILLDLIESKNAYEKIAIILKVIPIESFDEAFRFFCAGDQKKILEALEINVKIHSIETMMVINEFITKNDLGRFLKTATMGLEETIQAFQGYATQRPRQISIMLSQTWLEEGKK